MSGHFFLSEKVPYAIVEASSILGVRGESGEQLRGRDEVRIVPEAIMPVIFTGKVVQLMGASHAGSLP